MIPHIQTILAGRSDGVLGNCMQTAVAAALDLPIEAVPHFVQFYNWRRALALWAEGEGVEFDHYYGDTLADHPEGDLIIAAGRSPRDPKGTHVVLWQDGSVVHDVHPDQTGIVGEPIEFYHLWRAPVSSRAGGAS